MQMRKQRDDETKIINDSIKRNEFNRVEMKNKAQQKTKILLGMGFEPMTYSV
jgi:hypothetical protein